MICVNCQNSISDTARFCPHCGIKVPPNIAHQAGGRLCIKRDNQFRGFYAVFNISINNQDAGILANGEQLSFNLQYGTYNISLAPVASFAEKVTVTITPQQPNITLYVNCGLTKPKVYNIQYI